MASTLSTNMSLPIPGVGTEAGPTYAIDINNALIILDGHNHSAGSGVQINPAGLNINAPLTFNNNNATNLQAVAFTAQSSSALLQALYVAPGGEATPINDLFYTDGNGTAIQLTKAGVVNATIASLPGESYGAGTFTWKQGAGSTTPANFDIGTIVLRPNTAGTTNGITLTTPSAIASAYTLTLPALPGVQSFMTLDASGNILAPWTVDNNTIAISSNQVIVKPGGITTSQISSTAGILGTQIANSTVTGYGTATPGNLVANTVSGNIGYGTSNIAQATIDGANIIPNPVFKGVPLAGFQYGGNFPIVVSNHARVGGPGSPYTGNQVTLTYGTVVFSGGVYTPTLTSSNYSVTRTGAGSITVTYTAVSQYASGVGSGANPGVVVTILGGQPYLASVTSSSLTGFNLAIYNLSVGTFPPPGVDVSFSFLVFGESITN